MKLKHYFSGAMLMALMASCSNDLPEAPGQILENETTTYVRVSILGDATTRADEPGYENGTKDESYVKEFILTFYDAGRNYVGKTLVTGDAKVEDVDFNGNGNTVERSVTYIAQVDLPENINHPKYIIAYVNPTANSGDLGTEALDDATTFIRKRESISPAGYRTMNNSVYFNDGTGNTRYATEVDFTTQFYKNINDAKASTANSVEIVVERMEAKIKLNDMASIGQSKPFESNMQNSPDGKEYTLTFVPEAWFVNGIEKRSFLIKNYRNVRKNFTQALPSGTTLFTLSELNAAFSGRDDSFSVNDMTNKRSYWAIDPTYFNDVPEDTYPSVSYEVDYKDLDGKIINGGEDKYPLYYYSFNDKVREYIAAESDRYTQYNNNKVKTHEYVTENTLSLNTLRGTDAKAAMTSVVLVGHYIITKKNGGGTVFDGSEYDLSKSMTSDAKGEALAKAFYVRHEADGKRYVMLDEKEAIEFFLERGGSTLYVQTHNNDGTIKDNSYEPLRAAHLEEKEIYGVSIEDFKLVYPDKDMTNGSILSEQWRTLTFKNKNENIYIYDATYNEGKGGYKKLSDLSEAEMNALDDRMYSSFGVLEKFQAGKAYFNVPLKHIWGDLNSGTSSSNVFQPDKVKLGDYGVVRNHIYDLTINSISGLGTGIGDVNQPIVPPTENERYYVSTKLNILKWKVVSQNVDL